MFPSITPCAYQYVSGSSYKKFDFSWWFTVYLVFSEE